MSRINFLNVAHNRPLEYAHLLTNLEETEEQECSKSSSWDCDPIVCFVDLEWKEEKIKPDEKKVLVETFLATVISAYHRDMRR